MNLSRQASPLIGRRMLPKNFFQNPAIRYVFVPGPVRVEIHANQVPQGIRVQLSVEISRGDERTVYVEAYEVHFRLSQV